MWGFKSSKLLSLAMKGNKSRESRLQIENKSDGFDETEDTRKNTITAGRFHHPEKKNSIGERESSPDKVCL